MKVSDIIKAQERYARIGQTIEILDKFKDCVYDFSQSIPEDARFELSNMGFFEDIIEKLIRSKRQELVKERKEMEV